MDIKKRLAEELVAAFHSPEAAAAARAEFERVFQQREAPADIPEFVVHADSAAVSNPGSDGFDADLSRLLVDADLAGSRAEARRLLSQGAVEIDGRRVNEERVRLAYGAVIRAGRRRFARLINHR